MTLKKPMLAKTPHMLAKLMRWIVLLPFAGALCGCAPSELFSCIDRHCFVADCTNHHSCVSCCCCKHGSCRQPAPLVHQMLVLGKPSPPDAAVK